MDPLPTCEQLSCCDGNCDNIALCHSCIYVLSLVVWHACMCLSEPAIAWSIRLQYKPGIVLCTYGHLPTIMSFFFSCLFGPHFFVPCLTGLDIPTQPRFLCSSAAPLHPTKLTKLSMTFDCSHLCFHARMSGESYLSPHPRLHQE